MRNPNPLSARGRIGLSADRNGLPLCLFLLLALTPVLLLRDYTPGNELRYLSIADEALRNGRFFAFTNHGIPYADKPPLYFWIIMLGKTLFGRHCMYFLSLFSLVPAFLTTFVMDRWIAEETGADWRGTGRLLLSGTGLFLGMGIVLRMDMLMCLFIVLALRTFYRMYRHEGSRRRLSWLFPVYIFLAVFSKGPIGILVPLAATVAFLCISRRHRELPEYWGWKTWAVLLAGLAVWSALAYMEGGKEYLHNLLFHQTLGRAVNSFHHKAPCWYYLVSVWYSIAPWSLLLLGVIGVSLWKKTPLSELQKFFLTVLCVTFLLLSVISSKLQVYLLPAFPFIVYLAVTELHRFKWNPWLALSIAVPAAAFCVPFPAWIALRHIGRTALPDSGWIIALRHIGGTALPDSGWIAVAALLLTLTGTAALCLLYRRKNIRQTVTCLTVGFFLAVFAGGWALPKLNDFLGYRNLCEECRNVARENGLKEYYVWKISRAENMDVYLHQEVTLVSEEELEGLDHRDGVLMTETKRVEALPEALRDHRRRERGKYSIIVLK